MEIPNNVEIIETPTSTMWFDEDGILYSISKKHPPSTIEESQKALDDLKKIIKDQKVCMLLDITNSSPSSKEMRDFAAEEMPKIAKAIAIISTSALGRMVANLFFGLKPPPYPMKMFSDEKEVKEWLKQYL